MKIGGNTVELNKVHRVYLGLISGLTYALIHCFFRLLSKEPIDPFQVFFQFLFFAFFWYLIFFRLMRTKQNKSLFDISSHQEVSFYGVANQVIKTSGVNGVLYATVKQLVFNPETTGFVESPWSIDFENITKVEIYKILGLFDCGLRIYTKGNREFKFRVNEPQVWLKAIENKIKTVT